MNKRLTIFGAVVALVAAGAMTRIDFTPLAPVRLVKPSGVTIGYGFGASTNAERGAAIVSAQTAAASGDTIEVWADVEIATDTSIGKDGVRYWFAPVTVTKSAGTAGLVSDGGTSITFAIEGSARFITTVVCSAVKITGPSTVFTLAGRSCDAQYAGVSDIASIEVTQGTTTITLSEYSKSANYDAYWSGIGTHEIHCPLLQGDDNGVECTTLLGTGSTRVYASRIVSITDDALQVLLGANYRCYVRADSIEAALLSANTPCSGSARMVIECPRMIGGVTGGNTEIIGATIDSTGDANPVVNSSSAGNILDGCKLIAESGQDAIAGSATTVRGGLETTANISATVTYSSKTGDSVKLANTTPTATGLSVLGAVDASAGRTALGLGTADSPTFAGLTVSGGLSAGSVVGNVFARDASTGPAQNTPADATTYYWGTPVSFTTWATTSGKRRMIVPTNCTLTKAYVYFYQTAGSAETSTVYVRVNDTTDTAISSAVVNNASETAASNSAMSVTLSAGDFLEVKWVTPTWTTNPTSVAATTVLEFKTR